MHGLMHANMLKSIRHQIAVQVRSLKSSEHEVAEKVALGKEQLKTNPGQDDVEPWAQFLNETLQPVLNLVEGDLKDASRRIAVEKQKEKKNKNNDKAAPAAEQEQGSASASGSEDGNESDESAAA